jgi:hypothetical protein
LLSHELDQFAERWDRTAAAAHKELANGRIQLGANAAAQKMGIQSANPNSGSEG